MIVRRLEGGWGRAAGAGGAQGSRGAGSLPVRGQALPVRGDRGSCLAVAKNWIMATGGGGCLFSFLKTKKAEAAGTRGAGRMGHSGRRVSIGGAWGAAGPTGKEGRNALDEFPGGRGPGGGTC